MAEEAMFGDGADLLAEMLGGTSFGGVERDALGPLLVGLFPDISRLHPRPCTDALTCRSMLCL
jgi:hypothetical protein